MTADEARREVTAGNAVVCDVCGEIVMRARDVSDMCCTEDAPEIVDATYRLVGDEDEADRQRAFAWCTCLGWIATLQETARLAYECGLADSPHALETPDEIGAEQVRVAAQNAGLVPEDPDPFAHPPTVPMYGQDLQAWMRANPGARVAAADLSDSYGFACGGFEWWWHDGAFWIEGPHLPPCGGHTPTVPCVPVRGFWGDV